MSTDTATGPVQRAWSAWSRFWFTPADPTPLCLMRIVAGLLVLYVHIAYSFDLQALMGGDGWYSVEQADRERREWPQFVLPKRWPRSDSAEDDVRRFRMPPAPDQRVAVRQFVDNLTTASADNFDRVLRLLDSLPDSPGGRAETLRYLHQMESTAVTFIERDKFLARMVKADPNDAVAKEELPEYLLSLKEADREMFRADVHALLDVMPPERRTRSNMFTLLITQSSGDWQTLRGFITKVRNQPTSDERKAFLDYTEKWTVPPDEPEILTKGHWYYSPFYHVTEPTGVAVVHGVHLFVIVLFTLGVCTRVTSVLAWLAGLAYIQRNPVALFGQDTMMNLCLFYLMLAPCGATWSVDWLVNRYRSAKKALAEGRRPEPSDPRPIVSANFVIRLLQVHYCLMYLSAGLAKLKGESWWNGTAPWYCMTNPEFSPLHVTPFRDFLVWLCQDHNRWLWEITMSSTDVFTLVLEIGFPFLVWTRLRPIMVFGAILLHTGIALNMGLIVFSLFMFTLLLGAWMPPAAVRRVFARPPAKLPKLQANYDGRSPKQVRAASVVQALDVWGQAELTDRATKAPRNDDTVSEPVRITVGGEDRTGWAAARLVAKSLGLTQPFAWVLGMPIVAHIGAALYPSGEPTAKGHGAKEMAARS